MGLAFFGLTPKYREYLFSKIHEIVFYGNGGYDWETVYSLPISHRDFIYNKIREHFEKQNAEAEKQQKAMKPSSTTVKPPMNPTYTAKAKRPT